jgi:hypothetical protein
MKRPKAGGRKRAKPGASGTERHKKRESVIDDALLKEVGKANERIANPDEHERVIPSRPC